MSFLNIEFIVLISYEEIMFFDETIAVFIKNLENLKNPFLALGVLQMTKYHGLYAERTSKNSSNWMESSWLESKLSIIFLISSGVSLIFISLKTSLISYRLMLPLLSLSNNEKAFLKSFSSISFIEFIQLLLFSN